MRFKGLRALFEAVYISRKLAWVLTADPQGEWSWTTGVSENKSHG